MDTPKKRILIVDDDPLISRMYQNKMQLDGHVAEIAINGEEALMAVRKQKPDLILLDVMMPKLNGVETLKILKGEEITKNIPVIILTNLGDKPEDIDKAKTLGALDYLVKSQVSLKDLSTRVKKEIGL
jgi:DNA-binding response OmpR family regulator